MCGGGSGEGRGASEAQITKGWQANDKLTRDYRNTNKATEKDRRRNMKEPGSGPGRPPGRGTKGGWWL